MYVILHFIYNFIVRRKIIPNIKHFINFMKNIFRYFENDGNFQSFSFRSSRTKLVTRKSVKKYLVQIIQFFQFYLFVANVLPRAIYLLEVSCSCYLTDIAARVSTLEIVAGTSCRLSSKLNTSILMADIRCLNIIALSAICNLQFH